MFVFCSFITYWILLIILSLMNCGVNKSFKRSLVVVANRLIYLCNNHELLFHKLIKKTRPVFPSKTLEIDYEIHSVVCHETVDNYLLVAKSLLKNLTNRPLLVIHDDGSLEDNDRILLRKHLPAIKIWSYQEATKILKPRLKKFPYLFKERTRRSWNKFHVLSVLDVPFLATAKKIIYLDSDVIFFNKPRLIEEWIRSDNQVVFLYMRDCTNTHVLSKKELDKVYKKYFLNKFNAGLMCYSKDSLNFYHLDHYFKLLAKLKKNDNYFRDQTYWMIHASKYYKFKQSLTNDYLLSLTPEQHKNTICIHYVTPIRNLFFVKALTQIFTN